jgi:hypothetical protein
LGKALARIEAELRKARKKEADARSESIRANKEWKDAPPPEAFDTAKERADQEKNIEDLRVKAVAADEALQQATDTVSNLDSQRAALGAAAAAAWATAGASVSTRQQLNNLSTQDAIRSIPR